MLAACEGREEALAVCLRELRSDNIIGELSRMTLLANLPAAHAEMTQEDGINMLRVVSSVERWHASCP